MNQQMKKMFGLKDESDLKMADNIWKMLDDMADSDPSQYQNFINKNLKEGLQDAKHKKQQKQKPYKIKPIKGFLLTMSASLNEKPLDTTINEKVLITKQPWGEIKKKMAASLKIYFNITHSDRIKDLKSRSSGKIITKYSIGGLRDIELFYYSLQMASFDKTDKNQVYFCMILNSNFYHDILNEPAGKKYLLGLCISYLQERLSMDKNPLLQIYNPDQYQRLAFYNIDKFTVQISQKQYFYDGQTQCRQFLLQKQIDKKRESQLQKQKRDQQAKLKKQQKKPQIMFRQKQAQPMLSNIKVNNQQVVAHPKKKVLIEVLKEEESPSDDKISYQMKETQTGYVLQFLLKGVNSIEEVNLEMKTDSVQLQAKDKQQLIINFNKKINENAIKAKFKKKLGCLIVEAPYK